MAASISFKNFSGRILRLALILSVLFTALTACVGPTEVIGGSTATAMPAISTIATSLPQATATLPSSTGTPTQTPAPPSRAQYRLDATFDYDRALLQVQETISYSNPTSVDLNDLVLMIDPLYYAGVFRLVQLSIDNGPNITDPQQENGWFKIGLDSPLPPGESLEVAIDYELNLPSPVPSPDVRPIPFGYTERQANLVDWYPFIPPYVEGRGWLAHPAGYYGEHLVYEIADFEVNIHLIGDRQNLVIAASAPGVKDGDWMRYRHLAARNFAWSVSPYYQVISETTGGVTISSYSFSGYQVASQAVLDTTVKALEIYSDLFGPYPHQSLNVVQADFLDGMEYDGLYFLSKGFYNTFTGQPGEYLIAIAAHETAHQWWYAEVGNDQAIEPWLDEAFSTYSERLYYENTSPESLSWWWTYRINYYEPKSWVDTTIYNPHGYAQPYLTYRNSVYLNGANFLEELRTLMGDQEFFIFIKDYLNLQSQEISSGKAFFKIIRQHTSKDIQPLLDKYFFNQY